MMARTVTILGFVCLLLIAPAAMAICYPVEILLPYDVCTYYHSTGQTVCNVQWGWFDGWECWGGGGEYWPPYEPPGPGDPHYYPPPDCEITGISDENTNQTILTVWSNENVVEMSVDINGSTVNTVQGRTDQFMLQGVGSFAGGTSTITVSCRNQSYVYDQPTAEVIRSGDIYQGATLTHAYWQRLSLGGEPQDYWGDWYRVIDLLAARTSYSVPTFGARNGEWEHQETEDRLWPMGDTPKPIWDAVYTLDNPQLYNVHQVFPCPYAMISDSMCAFPYSFSRAGSPTGKGVITGMQIPFQSTLGAHVFAGTEVPVTPQ